MKLDMGFPSAPKCGPPNFTLSPNLGSKTQINAKNRILHFQMIKLCYKVVSINNYFKQQSCLSKCLEGDREHFLEIISYLAYAFYNDFNAPLAHYDAMFQALYF